MSDVQELRESFLNAFPAAALLLWQDRIVAVNGAVRRRLPQLEPGEPIPPELLALSGEGGGLVTLGGAAWRVQLTETKWGRLAVLIPAPQPALTDPQLDGALRQMRTYLAQMQLAAADIPPASQGMFWKSYYQLFRLTDNLDLLRQLGQPGTRDFHPAAMDLAALCRKVVDGCAGLLGAEGVVLTYHSALSSLLIPGDSGLLEHVLLELIANGARWTGRGPLTLSLRRLGTRAVVTVAPGSAPPPQQLDALLGRESDYGVPRPGSGAGLGMPLAGIIARLHGGSLMVNSSEAGVPAAILALPTGPMPTRVTVRTPRLQRDGGLSVPLVALADVLPARHVVPGTKP